MSEKTSRSGSPAGAVRRPGAADLDDGGNFLDDEHAYATGYLAGVLLREGVKVATVTDDDGNYTDELVITSDQQQFRIKVLPGIVDVWSTQATPMPPPKA